MNINIGSQLFRNVDVPILWGTRAILTDKMGLISIINLEGEKPQIEILGEKPAPKIKYAMANGGVEILGLGGPIYRFDPSSRLITSVSLNLPDVRIESNQIRVGNSVFSNNTVVGSGVGISVDERGMGIGGPLPPALAKLRF